MLLYKYKIVELFILARTIGNLWPNLQPATVTAFEVDCFPQRHIPKKPLALTLSVLVHGLVLTLNTDWGLWVKLVCPGISTMRVLEVYLVMYTIAWPTQRTKIASLEFQNNPT